MTPSFSPVLRIFFSFCIFIIAHILKMDIIIIAPAGILRKFNGVRPDDLPS